MIGVGIGLSFQQGGASISPPGPSSDTSLSVFTVNSVSVSDGQTVLLPTGTTSATVIATPITGATAGTPTGGTGMAVGHNDWSMDVTAEDGVTVHTYTLTLDVAPDVNNVTNLLQHTDSSLLDFDCTVPTGAVAGEYRVDGGAVVAMTGSIGSVQTTGPLTLGDHIIQARTIDADGNRSDWSTNAVNITIHTIVLDPPSNINMDNSSVGEIHASWMPAATAPFGYRVRAEDNGSTYGSDFDTTGTSSGYTGLTSGDNFQVFIKTLGDGGVYTESSEIASSVTSVM